MAEEIVSTTLPEEVKVKIEKTKTGSVKGKDFDLKEVLAKLMVAVPEQYLETYTEDGTEFKGYKAQYAINLLNEVFGLGKWFAEFSLDKVERMNGSWLSYGTVMLHIRLADNSTRLLADGIGGSYAKRIENSLKGCKTSAFKNACRYLGIGHELYLAGHDEDIVYVEEKETVEEKTSDPMPNEIKVTIDLINKATSVQELEAVLPAISTTEGKAVKDLLIKQFNAKKIALSEK